MRKLLLLVLLASCAPPRQAEPPPPFNPVLDVMFDCGDPCHLHQRPEDAVLDNEWPPVVCTGGPWMCNGK